MRGYFAFDGQRPPDQYIRELGSSLAMPDQAALSNIDLFVSRRDMWDELRRSGSDSVADEILSLTRPWGYHLQSIRVPVDIWWGESDLFCSPVVGERMAKMVPNARPHSEAQAGHLLLYTHWEAILTALTQG